MDSVSNSQARCGIILAGGEGQRLRPLVQRLRGESVPKQYVNFIGTRSMLEHSFQRAEMLIPRARLFTVVSRDHLKDPRVQRQLAGRPAGTVVPQPENRDTAPGILLPLMHLYKRHPESTVAIFPSDHFIVEERLFMRHIELAFDAVEEDRSRLIVLGIEPTEPEPEYGYILPDKGRAESQLEGPCSVKRFVEKPDLGLAQELILQGGLWNTMVMVCKTRTLVDLVHRVAPRLYHAFEAILKAIGAGNESAVVKETYRRITPKNFSRELLQILPLRYPALLSVLPVRGVSWSDWGLPRYVESALRRIHDQGGAERKVGKPQELFLGVPARRSLWKTA